MELITIEELVDKLSNMIDENVVFIFEGDIVGDIDMKLFRVKKDDDYLELMNSEMCFARKFSTNTNEKKELVDKIYKCLGGKND